jgi:hypothetical protein
MTFTGTWRITAMEQWDDDSGFTAIRGEKAARASRPLSRTPARRERR